jgi:hypothetical protein
MLAVLEDAIRCLQGHWRSRRARAPKLAREAEAWVRSSDVTWPCSFVNVCEALGIDPSALRAALLRVRRGELPQGQGYRLHLRLKKPDGPLLAPVALRA